MKRRDLIKNLTILPIAGSINPLETLLSAPAPEANLTGALKSKTLPELHRSAFVMDGHIHVMTREILMNTDIGQRYSDGSFDLPRAMEGGLDALFFSVYTPEHYYPGRFETKKHLPCYEPGTRPDKKE